MSDPKLSQEASVGRLRSIRRRLRAAAHEVRCRECRVTWRSWFQRLVGDVRGFSPEVGG